MADRMITGTTQTIKPRTHTMNTARFIDPVTSSNSEQWANVHETAYVTGKHRSIHFYSQGSQLIVMELGNAFLKGSATCDRISINVDRGEMAHNLIHQHGALDALMAHIYTVAEDPNEYGEREARFTSEHCGEVRVYITPQKASKVFSHYPEHLARVQPLKSEPKKWTTATAARALLNMQFVQGSFKLTYSIHDWRTTGEAKANIELAKSLLCSPSSMRVYFNDQSGMVEITDHSTDYLEFKFSVEPSEYAKPEPKEEPAQREYEKLADTVFEGPDEKPSKAVYSIEIGFAEWSHLYNQSGVLCYNAEQVDFMLDPIACEMAVSGYAGKLDFRITWIGEDGKEVIWTRFSMWVSEASELDLLDEFNAAFAFHTTPYEEGEAEMNEPNPEREFMLSWRKAGFVASWDEPALTLVTPNMAKQILGTPEDALLHNLAELNTTINKQVHDTILIALRLLQRTGMINGELIQGLPEAGILEDVKCLTAEEIDSLIVSGDLDKLTTV